MAYAAPGYGSVSYGGNVPGSSASVAGTGGGGTGGTGGSGGGTTTPTGGRSACAGAVASQGPCYQHTRASEKAVQQWLQNTKVTDYHSPPGSPVSVYTRFTSSHDPCTNTVVCTPTAGQPKCDQWAGTNCGYVVSASGIDGGIACSSGDSTHYNIAANCFIQNTGTVADMSHCRKYGGKWVQAWRTWHGMFGYWSHDQVHGLTDITNQFGHGSATATSNTIVVDCDQTDIELEQPTPDQIKYLTHTQKIVYDTSTTNVLTGSTTTGSAVLVRSASVNPNTGVWSRSCSDSYSDSSTADTARSFLNNSDVTPTFPLPEDPHNNHFGWNRNVVIQLMLWDLTQIIGAANSLGWSYDYTITKWGNGASLVAYLANTSTVFMTAACDPSTGYYHSERFGSCTDSGMVVHPTSTIHDVSIGPTSWTHSVAVVDYNCGSNLSISTNITVTGALSSTNPASNILRDLDNLLATWSLADDLTYPWRTDEYCSVAPIVHRNEVMGAVSPILGDCYADWYPSQANTTPAVDPNAACYDGSIVGAPAAIPGINRGVFDYLHRTYWSCCNTDSGFLNTWEYGYGAFAGEQNAGDITDTVVPKTATLWSHNFGAGYAVGNFFGPTDCAGYAPSGNGYPPLGGIPGIQIVGGGNLKTPMPVSLGPGDLPAGAWLMHYQGSGVVWRQKWCEVKIHRPSINFARPNGPDRYAMDENTVRCVQAGSTKASVNIDSATAINTNDLVYITGASGINTGVYKATKNSATNYSLTSVPYAPAYSYIETTTTSGYPNANGIIGKLRFPTAPGIAGRVAVYSTSGSNPTTFNTETQYLQTGDTVDIYDGAMTPIITNQPVTVFNGSTFSIPYGGGGAHYVQTNGSPAYQWNDSASKGDFVFAEWVHNLRDYQERQRVKDQYILTGTCSYAVPADMEDIRPFQEGYGVPRSVSAFNLIQHCLPFNKCNPQVMAITNNAEVFSGTLSVVHSMPQILLDERYGALWQGAYLQHVVDPFYSAMMIHGVQPHPPCVTCPPVTGAQVQTGCLPYEDNGACNADVCATPCVYATGQWIFPHPPLCEAKLALPGGAPTPPSGVFLGFLTIYQMNQPGSTGNVLQPPVGSGYLDTITLGAIKPVTTQTPWGIMGREASCICSSGRFKTEYVANEASYNC